MYACADRLCVTRSFPQMFVCSQILVVCLADGDPYRHTLEMLETLGFPELLPNFKQHMLRVSRAGLGSC